MADQFGAPGVTLVTNKSHALVASGSTGKFLCVRQSDGHILSLQQGGEQEYRVPPNDGPFEQCELVGSALVYDYVWPPDSGVRYIHKVAWVAAVD